MFADDTSLTAVGKIFNEAEEIAKKDLKNVKAWLSSNKLSLNIAKTGYLLIGYSGFLPQGKLTGWVRFEGH